VSRAKRGGAKGGKGRPSPGAARDAARTPGATLTARSAARWAELLPAAIALALALPTFSFVYLYDDYDFLGRAQAFRPSQLLPDPNLLFWRPLSREIYFGILYALDPNHPLWAHLGNAGAWLLSVALVGSILSRLAGARAGISGAIVFAGLGAVPVVVGWASGCQDLFAIALLLLALRSEILGKTWLALLCVAGALLSKETAVALVPAVALSRWILGEPPRRRVAGLAGYAIVVAAWALAHPGVGRFLSSGLESGQAGVSYLSLQSADRLASLTKGALTLGNLPIAGRATPWPSELNAVFAIAATLAFVGIGMLRHAGRRGAAAPGGATGGRGGRAARIVALGLLLSAPPFLLVSFLVHQWQPYYYALAAIGTSLIAGVALAALPWALAAAAVVGFLGLGVWCRGMDLGSDVLTERNVRPPMEKIGRVERSFRGRIGSLEPRTLVGLATYTPEDPAVPLHLFRFQALRLWYRDPSIDAVHPEWRRPDPPAERLAYVTRDLHVHEIDLGTLVVDGGRGDSTAYEYGATLRAYAQGLASTGATDRAQRILLAMPPPDSLTAAVNRRLAVALLVAEGRTDDAAALTRQTPRIPREEAIAAAGEILANPSRRDIDDPVLASLGLSAADTAATREMMRGFLLRSQRAATVRFAHRLLEAKPGDWEAQALVRWMRQGSRARRVVAPAVSDSLW